MKTIIEYLEEEGGQSIFEKTFKTEITSFHGAEKTGEAWQHFWYLEKTKVNSLAEALMTLVVQQDVRYGIVVFEEDSLDEIYSVVMNELKGFYQGHEFRIKDNLNPLDLVNRVDESEFRRTYRNENWDDLVSKNDLLGIDCLYEKMLACYELKCQWNDEDYFFETENHYLRFNWSTSV